jgi:tRNA(Ile)-lysidine synthase
MLNKVRNTIKKYGLLKKGDGVLIGLSGGADSVSLTHALHALSDELGIHLYTAHMNHCLRGEMADSDEKFAVEFSEKLGIKCITEHKNVRAYAEKNGVSEEMAGRELRYAFFEYACEKYGLNKIATAHNKNDNAETILMNFMRGSGLSGLCGIPCKRDKIIRPLIDVSRDEIEEYCRSNNLQYVTDSTNHEMIYTRNKIRLDLIPKIQNEFNSGFIDTVTKNASFISETVDFMNSQADLILTKMNNGSLPIEALNCHTAVKRIVILNMLKAAGINDITAEYVEAVLRLVDTNHSGKLINLPAGNIAEIQYGHLYIGKPPEKALPFEYKIRPGEKVLIEELGIEIEAEFARGGDVFKADENSTLVIRNRRNGDYFYPIGMEGKKKLKDYFIDCKIPRDERDKIGIFTIDDEIAWIVGKRRDRRFTADSIGIRLKLFEKN